MHEKAKFVCFIYMQTQIVKFKFVQIKMKHVLYLQIMDFLNFNGHFEKFDGPLNFLRLLKSSPYKCIPITQAPPASSLAFSGRGHYGLWGSFI